MSFNSPKQIVEIAAKLAIEKGKFSIKELLVLSFLAGAFIAFGGILALIVGGGSPGVAEANPGLAKLLYGMVFPIGLMLVVLAGAELFTGNNAYFIPAILNKQERWTTLLKNWFFVYFGNFIGVLFVVYFLVYLTDLVALDPWNTAIRQIAVAKVSAPFYVIFLKGIGANWLVCLALWMGISSQHTSGKILGVWWPIMAFVVMGFEHSIANMFFIPCGMLSGADITISQFLFANLLPTTLGNIVGGGFFVGYFYWFVYSKN